jgi:hypothetical protein
VAGSGRRIVVEFIGDASSLKSNAASGEKALQGFSGKAQAAGRIAGKALAGGLLLAGAAAISATKAAAEDEAAQSQLATQLRNSTGATDDQIATVEKYISSLSLATGVADDELRPSLAKLATATGDVGEAINLQRIAMDVAAGTGKSLAQVTDAMVKAQNGSVGGLGRLGVATKDATGATKSFAEIQNDLATKYQGAAARAADTTAGKTKIMTVQFGELQEQIGAKLLPVMVKLSEEGLKAVNWISQNTTTVGVLVAALGGLLAVTWAVGVATKAFSAIQTVWAIATKAVTAGQWLLNAALSANPIGLVVIAIAALVAGLIIAYKKSETFRAIVNAAFGAIKGVVMDVVGWFGRWVPQVFSAVVGAVSGYVNTYKAVVTAAFHVVQSVVSAVADFVVGSAKKYGQFVSAVVDKVGEVVSFFKQLPGKIKGFLEGLPGELQTIGVNIIMGLVHGLESVGHKVTDYVTSLINKIPKKIRELMGISSPSKVTKELGGYIGDGLADGIAAKQDKVDSAAKKLIDKLKDRLSTLKDAFKSLKESVAGAFTGDIFQAESASGFVANLTAKKGQLAQLSSAFKTLLGWGWKPKALAALFQSGNAGLILDLAGNKDLATQGAGLYNDVTGMSEALGGQVAGGMYGDQIDKLQSQIKGQGGNARTVNVTVNMGVVTDPVAAAREVVKAVRKLERADGRQLLYSPS